MHASSRIPAASPRPSRRAPRPCILNSPNNPTGAVYGADVLRDLNAIVREPVLVISDEPYRPLVYDGVRPPEIASLIERVVVAWSWSKAMAIAGERIGYLAIPPHLPEAAAAAQRLHFRQPHSGLHQRARDLAVGGGEVPDATVDVAQYQAKRDLLCDALSDMGYDAPRPQGSYYVFPKTPIADDVAFIRLLQAGRHSGGARTGFRPRRIHAAVAHHSAERYRAFPPRLRARDPEVRREVRSGWHKMLKTLDAEPGTVPCVFHPRDRDHRCGRGRPAEW